jgi:medium-chain acyl-[acyl-carrier-protein] hydrolase
MEMDGESMEEQKDRKTSAPAGLDAEGAGSEKTSKAIPEEYRETHVVDIFDAGPTGEVKLSVLFRICQNVCFNHLEKLGLGYLRLRRDGMVFLIISNKAEISRMPRYGEKLEILTYPRGSAGVTFYRGFEVFSGGERLVKMMQSSALVSPEDHKLLRPKDFYAYGVFQEVKTPREEKISRISPQGGETMPLLGERMIRYSDLDCNHHMNNTIYADVLEDFLPGGHEGRSYASVQVDYVSEALFGETITLRGEEKDGVCILQGFHDRGLSFSARAEMKKIDGNG